MKEQINIKLSANQKKQLQDKATETGLTMTTIIILSLQSWMKDN